MPLQVKCEEDLEKLSGSVRKKYRWLLCLQQKSFDPSIMPRCHYGGQHCKLDVRHKQPPTSLVSL